MDLINWFYENEISIAAATNSKRHEIERKIVNHTELFKKFQHITTGDEVERLKPYPDIYLHSASKFIFLPEPTEVSLYKLLNNSKILIKILFSLFSFRIINTAYN